MTIAQSGVGEVFFPVGIDIVDLPSRGRFYSVDHPLHGQESVEIYHMRGQEEDILTNVDYMKKGVTIDKLLQSLFVNQELKNPVHYNKLLAADRTAILIAARITAYTWEYPINVTCPKCEHKEEFEFDIRKQKVYHGLPENTENIVYYEDSNTFKLTFPDTNISIVIVPRTSEIENKITKKLSTKNKQDITNKDLYEDIVVNIQGHTDSALIRKFFEQIPSKYLAWFKSAVILCNPDVSLEDKYKCSSCEFEKDLEPPFTSDFLFPKTKNQRKYTKSHENSE